MLPRCLAVVCTLALACNHAHPAGTDSDSGGATTSTGTTSATSTTGASWSEQHGPCAEGVCPGDGVCVELDGASVCGPPCGEKGPGFVRCPASEVQAQTICPWPGDGPEAPCLLSCTDHDDCPDPGMVCLPCPEVFAADCPLGDTFGEGPHMCAWPVEA